MNMMAIHRKREATLMPGNISPSDIRALEKTAKGSKDSEAYRVIWKGEDYSIAALAKASRSGHVSFSLEITVLVCLRDRSVDLRRLRAICGILEWFERQGYALACLEDGCVSCEKEVESRSLSSEYKGIKSIIWAIDARK
jgi:hypothetical protein